MKVAHCLAFYSDTFKGGIQRYIQNVVREQAESIETQILTTTAFSNGSNGKGISRAKSYGTFLRTPVSPALPFMVRGQNCDVIHFHSPNPLIDLSSLSSKQKCVLSVHNSFPDLSFSNYPFVKIANAVFRRNLFKASRVIVYQRNFLNGFFKDGDIPEEILEKTSEVPPGIDRSVFQDKKMERNNDILFVSHIRPEKGLDTLVDAFRFIRHADSRLIVLAKASYFKGYFNRLITKARRMYGEKFVAITEPLDEDIINAYNSCGCVVCPSTALESWNFMMMEAASCGAAVVRTDLKALEWLKEPACVVAKAGDARDLAEKIDFALDNRTSLGENAKKAVKAHSWKDTAKSLIRIYNEVLE